MANRHLSVRVDPSTFERLDAECRRTGRSRSDVAKTLLEEGLRMQAHPGIVFRPGPTGRRPGLAAGADVWEVIAVLRELKGLGEEAIARTAELMALSPTQVRAAARYYADYQDEIDEWIDRNNEEAERAEAAWRREQALLRR